MKFQEWFVESTTPTTMQANIPVPPEAKTISWVLKQYNPEAEVYMVGGAVRDYLFAIYHGGGAQGYKPKDVDLTTNLSEQEILEGLRTPLAQQHGIRVNEKTSVDTFGVVFVSVGQAPTIEVAPFRKDIGGTGRRPDAVERGTMFDDAMRRDFTINNLYYDFDRGVIVDLNPNSQGIKDIQEGPVIRPVGNPYDRFNEDKLRILRLMRFFSRFNAGDIRQFLDRQTLEAIQHYSDLPAQGITPERILDEFTKGIKSAQDTAAFLQNYASLDLFKSVFPRLQVAVQDIPRIGNSKNLKVIYAILLRANGRSVEQELKQSKYPAWMFEGVQFMVDLLSMMYTSAGIGPFIKRKMRLEKTSPPALTEVDLQELIAVAHGLIPPAQLQRIQHLLSYQWTVPSGPELQKLGYQGAEIGKRQAELGTQHYSQSWDDYQQANPLATPTGYDPQRTLPGTRS